MKIDTPAGLCECRTLNPSFTTPAEDSSLSETSFAACVRPVRTRENGGNGVGDVSPAYFLNHVAGREPGSPGPLKVIAAKPAGNVHDFTDKVEARFLFRFHGL